MAPDLLAASQRYDRQDVVFIGITSDTRSEAESFCAQYGISYTVICEAEQFLKSWLADHYPALVVVGRDGNIIWNDGAARLRHRTDDLMQSLHEAIESAL